MSYTEKDYEIFKKNELKSEDTFHFECEMCGRCCRKRNEPIMLTGADIFRISKALSISIEETIINNTTGYIGESSHIPIFVLKERQDGSCCFFCATGNVWFIRINLWFAHYIHLDDFFDMRDSSFHYFLNQRNCEPGKTSGKKWTLQEWLDKFKIKETEAMTESWNKLMGSLAQVTCEMCIEEITGRLLDVLIGSLYTACNLDAPYKSGYIVFEDGGTWPITYGASEKWFPTYDAAMKYAMGIVTKRIEELKGCVDCNSVIVYEGGEELMHKSHSCPCGRVVFEWRNYHRG